MTHEVALGLSSVIQIDERHVVSVVMTSMPFRIRSAVKLIPSPTNSSTLFFTKPGLEYRADQRKRYVLRSDARLHLSGEADGDHLGRFHVVGEREDLA